MAYIFKQSKKWCARIRREGQEIFEPGFDTKKEAKDWALAQEALCVSGGSGMLGLGPNKTTLAVALRDYAYTVVTTQDGCLQVISKINKYLRAADLPELHAKKVRGGRTFGHDKDGNIAVQDQEVETTLYELTEVRDPAVLFEGARQAAFAARALDNDERNAQPQVVRERLARLPVSKIKSFHLTELMSAMNCVDSHYADATRRQELAILSGFFTNAMSIWNWPLAANPALKIRWPKGGARERILTTDETTRMALQLKNCTNKGFQIFVLFAMETAMRKGEMLWTACWCDIDRNAEDGDVLKLVTAKAGRREVPLTPFALWLLEQLPRGKDHDRIFDLTESAINSAWKRLCSGADIVNFHIHDSRHCAATMYAGLRHCKCCGNQRGVEEAFCFVGNAALRGKNCSEPPCPQAIQLLVAADRIRRILNSSDFRDKERSWFLHRLTGAHKFFCIEFCPRSRPSAPGRVVPVKFSSQTPLLQRKPTSDKRSQLLEIAC